MTHEEKGVLGFGFWVLMECNITSVVKRKVALVEYDDELQGFADE